MNKLVRKRTKGVNAMNEQLLRLNIDRDLNEIMRMVKEYMNKTYIQEIESELYRVQVGYRNESSKEAELLRALIPFMPQDKQPMLSDVVRIMRYEQVASEMMPRFVGHHRGRTMQGDDKIKELIVKLMIYKMLDSMENRMIE